MSDCRAWCTIVGVVEVEGHGDVTTCYVDSIIVDVDIFLEDIVVVGVAVELGDGVIGTVDGGGVWVWSGYVGVDLLEDLGDVVTGTEGVEWKPTSFLGSSAVEGED